MINAKMIKYSYVTLSDSKGFKETKSSSRDIERTSMKCGQINKANFKITTESAYQ